MTATPTSPSAGMLGLRIGLCLGLGLGLGLGLRMGLGLGLGLRLGFKGLLTALCTHHSLLLGGSAC